MYEGRDSHLIVSGDHVAHFVANKLGFSPCPPFTTMGLQIDGKLVGGIIFSNFEGCDVQVSAWGKGWTSHFLSAVGQYVYDQLGCLRMTFLTEQPTVANYATRLGGTVEGRLRSHYGEGRDAIIVGCLRDEWKWRKMMR